MMMIFWDAMSLMILVYWALPAVLLCATREPVYAWLCIALVASQLLMKFLHHGVRVFHPVMERPSDAMNCSILNRGGCYKGRNGMPSGHVTTTTFVLLAIFVCLCRTITGPRVWWLGAAVGTLIALMCASRYYRKCHNLHQIAAGLALGCVLTAGFVRLVPA